MSDLGVTDAFFEEAKEAQRAKDYEIAYRNNLSCEITFDNGELPEYIPSYRDTAKEAGRRKWKMTKKLPQGDQRRLRREYRETFGYSEIETLFLTDDWRKNY